MSVFLRRRLLALVVVLAAAAAALPFLLGDDDTPATPGAESAASTEAPAEEDEEPISLLTALAPLFEDGGEGGDEGARSGTASRTASGEGGGDVGLSPASAAARLFVIGFGGTDAQAPFFERLARREWGGVLLGPGNVVSRPQIAALTTAIRTTAAEAGHPVPIVAVRQAGGADSDIGDAPPRPQDEQDSAEAAAGEARAAAQLLRELGIGLTLAPDADLASAGGPWASRSFSEDPAITAERVRAAVGAYREVGVATAVGHFPGEGAASQDPRLGVASVGIGLDALRERDLRPFEAVARTTPVVAMSEALYAALDGVTPATLLPEAVELLRSTGFDGAVLSGDLGAVTFATGGTPGEAAVDALLAGCDLLLLRGDSRDQEQAVQEVARAIRSGTIPAARVREALRRGSALRERYAREALGTTAQGGAPGPAAAAAPAG